ncbi:MAG: hypothetical protein IBX44_01525 [Sulfurospirillum sp.]|nr:hypothetical protein [Sulfurospirillum sp.]
MMKHMLYTGLGVMSVFKDKVEEEVKKLEEKGKLKKEDAKSFMDTIEKRGKEEDEKMKQKIKDVLKEIIDELGIATKEDIQKLKEEMK